MKKIFVPDAGHAVKIAANSGSQRVAFTGPGKEVLIYNDGTTLVFIRYGDSTVVAAAVGDVPIPPGNSYGFGRGEAPYVAAIRPSGSGDVYFTTGTGI
jgi:hypothetical protein